MKTLMNFLSFCFLLFVVSKCQESKNSSRDGISDKLFISELNSFLKNNNNENQVKSIYENYKESINSNHLNTSEFIKTYDKGILNSSANYDEDWINDIKERIRTNNEILLNTQLSEEKRDEYLKNIVEKESNPFPSNQKANENQ